MSSPSELAIYERARRFSSNAMWAIAIQRRRLQADEPEDAESIFRRFADFDFMIVALFRLRRAALLAAKVPAIENHIKMALNKFDTALPMIKNIRDVAEHFDDYAMDHGRLSDVSRKSLEVWMVSGTTFEWLGYKIDTDTLFHESELLFEAIKKSNLFPSDTNP
jgi:hypothetical protein